MPNLNSAPRFEARRQPVVLPTEKQLAWLEDLRASWRSVLAKEVRHSSPDSLIALIELMALPQQAPKDKAQASRFIEFVGEPSSYWHKPRSTGETRETEWEYVVGETLEKLGLPRPRWVPPGMGRRYPFLTTRETLSDADRERLHQLRDMKPGALAELVADAVRAVRAEMNYLV